MRLRHQQAIEWIPVMRGQACARLHSKSERGIGRKSSLSRWASAFVRHESETVHSPVGKQLDGRGETTDMHHVLAMLANGGGHETLGAGEQLKRKS